MAYILSTDYILNTYIKSYLIYVIIMKIIEVLMNPNTKTFKDLYGQIDTMIAFMYHNSKVYFTCFSIFFDFSSV